MNPTAIIIRKVRMIFMLSVTSAFLFAGATMSATLVINEPFNSPVGGIPNDWTAAPSGSPILEISEYQPEDYRLQIARISGGAGGIMYTGTQGDIVGGVIQDFQISTLVLFSSGSNDARGITARAQTATFAYSGYWAYTVSGNRLVIAKDPTSAGVNRGTELASVTMIESVSAGNEYLYTFTGTGNLLMAEVYKQDLEGEYTILLGRVSVEDDSYSEGKMGYMVRQGGNNRREYIRNYELTSIPEPLTVSLVVVLGVACFLRRRK